MQDADDKKNEETSANQRVNCRRVPSLLEHQREADAEQERKKRERLVVEDDLHHEVASQVARLCIWSGMQIEEAREPQEADVYREDGK